MSTDLHTLQGLEDHLSRWVADGVVTQAQAELIRAEERTLAPAGRTGRESVVTEAVGYVGGLLVVVASILLAAVVWKDLSTGARVGLVGGAAVLLTVVGAFMPSKPGSTGERLRSVVWVLSTAATAFFLGLFAAEVLDLHGPDIALTVTAGASLDAAVLWRVSRLFPQQLACFGFLAGTAAAVLAELGWTGNRGGAVPGLGILAIGALWVLRAGVEPFVPVRGARVLGGFGVVVGAITLQGWGWSRPLALAGVIGLAVLATWWDDLALLAIAAFGILVVVPVSVNSWFPGQVSAPLALLVAGAVMVGLALRSVRRRQHL